MNNLEMLAIKFGLTSLLDHISDQHIRIQSDSLTAISYVMSMGGCHSEQCDSVVKEIWTWAIDHNIWLSAAHTPGKLNVAADKLSRDFNMTVEWQLHPTIFERISTVFSPPNIDLFASRINRQLDPYVSWKLDPNALFIDAFRINWGQFTNSYAFPPFCLISRCLKKVVQENASMIIVVPIWTTQAWFTRLLSLLIDHPKILQVTKDVLINPVLGNTHPLSHHLWLMACKTSGLPSLNARFLQPFTEIIMSSWKSTTKKQYSVYLHKWNEFCIQRQIDPMRPTVNKVLDFLHTLYVQDLSYSTINTARSATASSLLDVKFMGTDYTMSDHPLLVRYMKGVFNSRKPTPKYSETWDVNQVLTYIKKLYPLDQLTLKDSGAKH